MAPVHINLQNAINACIWFINREVKTCFIYFDILFCSILNFTITFIVINPLFMYLVLVLFKFYFIYLLILQFSILYWFFPYLYFIIFYLFFSVSFEAISLVEFMTNYLDIAVWLSKGFMLIQLVRICFPLCYDYN